MLISARRALAALMVVGGLVVGAGLASLLAPAAGYASCAGCNQYTNPLSTTPSHTQTTPPASSTSQSAPPQTATSPAVSTTPTPSTTPASSGVDTSTQADAEPTATASGTRTAAGSSLPRTGYDGWTVAGFGVIMLGGGLVVRRRLSRRP